MIIVGAILLLLAYLVPQPYPLPEIESVGGWILVVVGLIFLFLSLVGRPVGGRRYWW